MFMACVATALLGCSAELGSDGEQVELQDGTRLLENDESFVSADVSPDQIVLTFSRSADDIDLDVGDVIIGAEQDGYLRKITSVERSGTTLTARTEAASLTDAIARGTIAGEAVAADSDGWVDVTCPEGLTCRTVSLLDLTGFELFNGDVGGVPLSVTIDGGNLDLEPSFDMNLELGLGGIETFSATAGGRLSVALDVTAVAGGAIELAQEIDLSGPDTVIYRHPFTFLVPSPLGPLPVVGALELDVFVGFEANFSAQATARTGFDGSATLNLGAEFADGEWSLQGEPAISANSHPLTLEGQASADIKAFLRPELRAVFYGVAGPGFALTSTFRGQGQFIPPAQVAAQVEACLRGDLDFTVEILSAQLANFSTDAERCDILLQEGIGTEPLTITADDGDVVIDTDKGTITRVADGANLTPEGIPFARIDQGLLAPNIGVFSASEITIEAGATVSVQGNAALALHSAGDVTIDGLIDATAGRDDPTAPGPGGFRGGVFTGPDTPETVAGRGPGGGLPVVATPDVGGGGGGHGGRGGSGGNRDQVRGAGGGTSYGNAVILIGGSGGSLGGGDDGDGSGRGGGGGGAIRLFATNAVTIGSSGAINCAGAGGEGGAAEDGGGGGGAGGSIVIQAKTISIDGILAANGGGGGAGADLEARGASGQSGKLGAQPALGGAGAGEGSAGGDGGAGDDASGKPGVSTQGVEGDDNAGGGGGAAGRILLVAPDQTINGTVSPAPIKP